MNYFKKISLLGILGLFFFACSSDDDPYGNSNPAPNQNPPGTSSDIVFQEVRFNQNDRIELVNLGSSTVDISAFWLCSRFSYAQLSSLTLESGSLNLAAGDSVILSGFSLNDTEADLGLFSTNSFGSSSAILDFLQWGSAGIGRESVAVEAGIWTAGDFIQGIALGSSLVYDGSGNAASDYSENPSPSLGDTPVNTPASTANIRLIQVDTDQEIVEIKNFGPDSMDISSYQLCLGPGQYNILSDYTTITGNLNLAANETLRINLSSGSQNVTALPDASGALGLFANTSFSSTSPDELKDFVQWGAANQNRVDQAVTAGRWGGATEFVAGASPYTFVGDTSNTGVSQWIDDTIIRMITINTSNDEVTIKNFDQVERDLSNYFFCTLAGVYPQLGNASEVQIITGDLSLSPNEEVTVKVLTSGGVVDTNGSIFLFSSNALGFNNQNAAVTRDFAQWQAANGFRVDNAVSTGRWDAASSFIAGVSPYTFSGTASEVGASFWSGN